MLFITLGIVLAIFLTDCFRLYAVAGILFVIAGIAVFWHREVVFEYVTGNVQIKIIGIVAVAALVLYITQHFFVMRIGVCVGYWGAMLVLVFMDLFPVKRVMFLLAAELMFVIAECYDRVCYKEETKRNKKMFSLWPAALVLIMVLSFLPYNAEPFKWSRTKNFIKTVVTKFDVMADVVESWSNGKSEFSIGFTGYNKNSNFFGNKIRSEEEALDLTIVGSNEHIYLLGNVKNEYTGRGWEGTPKSSIDYGDYKEYQLDAAEYLYAMYRVGIIGDNSTWFVRYRTMSVKYAGINTSSLFRPSKTLAIETIKCRGEFRDVADNVDFSKSQNKKTEYKLEYLALNRSANITLNAIKEQSQYKYGTMTKDNYQKFKFAVQRKYSEILLPNTEDFEALLKQRADYIRETYLELPTTVTKRTYELAEKITKNQKTDYDKIMAIVEYLSDYEYTLTPGGLPAKQDVVDYFLFDLKKGYCTHFATAAAVLARCVGIPARYVQGYLLDINNIEDYGQYIVNEGQVHAWIECYFEGVGWLTFEPTSGNGGYLYQDWNLPENLLEIEDDESVMDNPNGEDPDAEEGPDIDFDGEYVEDSDEDSDGDDEELEEYMPQPELPDEQLHINPYTCIMIVIIIVVIVVVISIIIYQKACEARFWRIYKNSSYDGKICIDLMMILWILQKAGYPMDNTETLGEYCGRMGKNLPDRKVAFENVCSMYMKIRYGNKKESNKEEYCMAQRLRLSFMDNTVNEHLMARQCLKMLRK